MLQQIVHQLDDELERLQVIRDIVAGLQSAPLQVEIMLPDVAAEAKPASTSPAKTEQPTPRKRAQPRERSTTVDTASVTKKRSAHAAPTPELRALRSTIPAGPVVVSAQNLARERQDRVAGKAAAGTPVKSPEADGAALDALSRSLANRWRLGTDSPAHTP